MKVKATGLIIEVIDSPAGVSASSGKAYEASKIIVIRDANATDTDVEYGKADYAIQYYGDKNMAKVQDLQVNHVIEVEFDVFCKKNGSKYWPRLSGWSTPTHVQLPAGHWLLSQRTSTPQPTSAPKVSGAKYTVPQEHVENGVKRHIRQSIADKQWHWCDPNADPNSDVHFPEADPSPQTPEQDDLPF